VIYGLEEIHKKIEGMASSKSRKSKFRVTFLPFDSTVHVSLGTNLLDAIKEANLPLKTTCGGKATCGDCAVQILKGNYRRKISAVLPDDLTQQGYVLACLTEVEDDLTVQLPQFQEIPIRSVSTSRFFEEYKDRISAVHEVSPVIKLVRLPLPRPTLDDNYSDLRRLERQLLKKLKIKVSDFSYSVLKKLAWAARQEETISVTLFKSGQGWTVIDVNPCSEEKGLYGIACDIGTTTVALYLVNLESGEILSRASSFNQQLKCGEDIISRINYAQKPGRLKELQDLVITTINHLIDKAARLAQVSTSDITYAFFSGNTTMIHLFLNLEPRYIREEPYVPTVNQVPIILSRDLGVDMAPEGRVQCGPAVGSYVGSDITAGLLCTPLVRDDQHISLFMDIGTNGELVLGNKDWLMTCACSAGPAFEGGGIKCGMPAAEGAIERLNIEQDGKSTYQTIDGTKPKGVCGSGLVDILAELFIHGFIDRQGKFNTEKIEPHLVEVEEEFGFLIEKRDNCFWGRDLIITERDIANLIRTKGAVFSACSLLLKNAGITFDQINSFYIAGGFGQHLNIENGIRIGLLPDLDRKKFHYIGNSSLLGGHLSLISEQNQKMVNEVSERMTYIELNTEPRYMNEFTGALFLPHTEMDLFPSVKKLINH